MLISKRKVVSLEREEKELIERVICLLDELEDELEDEYDYLDLKDALSEIQYKEWIIEDENFGE